MSASSFAGSGSVRAPHRFDEERRSAWMAEHITGFVGPLHVEQFNGGQSNPTYRLQTPEHSYVLRRKPPGDLLKGAHAVEREARVMHAVRPAGIPVPEIRGLCLDADVIGTTFYVMDLVDGRIFWDPTLPSLTPEDRASVFDAMNSTMANLHQIEPASVGLSDFGRPGGYFERQITRWTGQYLKDEVAGRDRNLDRLVEWLPKCPSRISCVTSQASDEQHG